MSFALSGGARTISASGGTGTVTANVWALARIRWVSNAATQGDECTVTDTAGNVIFDSEAQGAQWSDEIELGKMPPFLGIKISVLTSGVVYFYLR